LGTVFIGNILDCCLR